MNTEAINKTIRDTIEEHHTVSISYLQRVCGISYEKALESIEKWVENYVEGECDE